VHAAQNFPFGDPPCHLILATPLPVPDFFMAKNRDAAAFTRRVLDATFSQRATLRVQIFPRQRRNKADCRSPTGSDFRVIGIGG
jgi:hypothetical protein